MSQPFTHQQTPSRTWMTRAATRGLGLAAAAIAFAGCNVDSFINPSVTGRWERTPTKVPILTHLAAIEDEDASFVEITDITPADLLPESEQYRIGPGDFLNLTIWDLLVQGQPEVLPRAVDQNGYISIPQLGRIFVTGLSETEVADAIAARMADIVEDPLVSVVVAQRRQQVFHLMGSVPAPGPYVVPASDYRLLQALVGAGGFPEFVEHVYVIRQVPLTAEAAGRAPENPVDFGSDLVPIEVDRTPTSPGEAEDLLDVIDDLGAPAIVGAAGDYWDTLPSFATIEQAEAERRRREQPEPIVDLIPSPGDEVPGDDIRSVGEPGSPAQGPRWIFREGKWVRVTPAAPEAVTPAEPDPDPLAAASGLFTQRIIRVPVRPLVSGDARYNIVVRPGDIVRVPPSPVGNIYMSGFVARPGVYQLPPAGKLTLQRAIDAAGGLGGLAIPERVDLTRMVGNDEQATIMLDLRSIAEGTQPDIYLKPNDRINVGTNFWATPLAVIRGGFRASYGFGFLLDRNFGPDVFGPPPQDN